MLKVIKVVPWGNGQGDFVLVNEDDFDPNVHKVFGATKAEDAEIGESDTPLKIGKGPGGRIYIFDMSDGKKIYSGPFETEEAADEALKVVLAQDKA